MTHCECWWSPVEIVPCCFCGDDTTFTNTAPGDATICPDATEDGHAVR